MKIDLFSWEQAIRQDRRLSPMARLLALLLRTYLNRETAEWSIGITRLAAEMGNVHRETVKRARRELVDSGYLVVLFRTGRVNTYRAVLPGASTRQGERLYALGVAHRCADSWRTHAPLTTQVNPSPNSSSNPPKRMDYEEEEYRDDAWFVPGTIQE